jgi:type I restriction enzyme M protein
VAQAGFEYQAYADRLATLDTEIAAVQAMREAAKTKGDRSTAETTLTRLEKPRKKLAAKVTERNERIAESGRRAKEDRQDVDKVGDELVALYADPDELLKHARVVGLDEIEENEFDLNIPRYVDTFEPEPRIEVKNALKALAEAEKAAWDAESQLRELLKGLGYAH